MVLGALASVGVGLPSGFLFGTGYGAGVRFGYEDVYPYLKGNMSQIANLLKIPFASSGFKLASGVTERQGMGLQDAEAIIGGTSQGLATPDNQPEQSASGRVQAVITDGFLPKRADRKEVYAVQRHTTNPDPRYKFQLDYYRFDGTKWTRIGYGFSPKRLSGTVPYKV